MKLTLEKTQPKGLLGKVNFQMVAKVELTKEENELVDRYKIATEPLLYQEKKIPFTNKVLVININILSLIIGQTFKCKNIAEIIEYEKEVKIACETFKCYLDTMKAFGGTEEIEY
ncbi:MAG: hypothetical protein MUF15_27225 [Acidobacteria bacterium]|jgi:hypothetical protein|nr:hypothetical protein [Acidobacteriota bacterium]